MRLTAEQIEIIRKAVFEVFGPEAGVWLFGSRVDDNRRGGDIDLYIEAPIDDMAILMALENRLYARLQRLLGERRIDIVSRARGQPLRAIHQQARCQGVRL